MRRTILVAVIFTAGFMARGIWTGLTVEAEGDGRGGAVPINGDVNADGRLDVSDGIYLINYVFRGGPLPVPIECPLACLPATGQTKCYDNAGAEIACDSADYPGHDGFYQAGCPGEGRFIDNQDGTVTDTCTGLMGQKDTADTNGDGLRAENDWLDWQGALKYCESLSFAGHDNWRLPSVRELQSIIDYGRYGPSIDPMFRAVSSVYWSSTSYVASPDHAWFVNFTFGYVYGESYKTYSNCVRAVRSGP